MRFGFRTSTVAEMSLPGCILTDLAIALFPFHFWGSERGGHVATCPISVIAGSCDLCPLGHLARYVDSGGVVGQPHYQAARDRPRTPLPRHRFQWLHPIARLP